MTAAGHPYELTLYVGGASEHSARAVVNATELCELHLGGRGRLTVVDLYEHPDAGLSSGVLVAPTLVVTRPVPERKLVGDFSDPGRTLLALGLAHDG